MGNGRGAGGVARVTLPRLAPGRVWVSTIESPLSVQTPGTLESYRCVVCLATVITRPYRAGVAGSDYEWACNRCDARGVVKLITIETGIGA